MGSNRVYYNSAQTQGQNGVYCYKTGNKNVGLAAVDSEGIASPTIVSGVKVPEGTITDTVKPVTFNPAGGATVYYGNTVTLSTTTPNATATTTSSPSRIMASFRLCQFHFSEIFP